MRTSVLRFGLAAAVAAAAFVQPASNAAEAPALPMPRAGCVTFTDPKGDGETGGEVPNDPDLDIVNVVFASPPGAVRAYIQVDKLGASEYSPGHQFVASFVLDSKPVTLYASQHSPSDLEDVQTAGAGAGALPALNGVTHNGVRLKDAKLDVVWDEKASMVVLTADRASIEAAAKVPLPDGTVVKSVTAKSLGHFMYTAVTADTATGATPEASEHTLGTNPCFAPPEGKLALQVPASVVAGHVATVTGTLTTAAGAAVGGKTVSVTFAGKTVEATSGADGAVEAEFPVTSTAGSYPVTATWAGDDTLSTATATAPLVVTIQPTTTTLTSAVSGTSVIVKATLLDDLRKPVAGQTVTWLVDGKAAGSTKTDAAGRAQLKTVKGKTVKATFAGVRNRYGASTASRRT